jgi:hypothetical protein
MLKSLKGLPALALFACLATAAPTLAPASPGAASHPKSRALLPPDAYSLALPEKLASPRDVQHGKSPLNLALPAAPGAEAESSALVLAPHSELLFPKASATLDVLPSPEGKSLLCIREDLAPQHHLAPANAAEAADPYFSEALWYDDPELAETAAKAAEPDPALPIPAYIMPQAARRDARSLLSGSILKLDRDVTPEFIYGEDGEGMDPYQAFQAEPPPPPVATGGDSADFNNAPPLPEP